jgi:hypothetical protein
MMKTASNDARKGSRGGGLVKNANRAQVPAGRRCLPSGKIALWAPKVPAPRHPDKRIPLRY